MNVEIERQGGCYCKLIVTLSHDEVAKGFQKARASVAKRAHVPGFRPGKLPRQLLDKQFAASIEQAAIEGLIDQTLPLALQQANVEPIVRPNLETVGIKPGAEGRYTVSFEVRPEISLQKIVGLKAPSLAASPDASVVDAAYERELAQMRERASHLVPVEDRHKIEEGDTVVLDYEGHVDDQPIARDEGALVAVGGQDYIPGFAEGLIGQSVPGQCTVSPTFPADYNNETLRGKTAHFSMKLHEIKRRQLPNIDDAFAQDAGFASLQDLQDKTRERLDKEAKAGAKAQQRRALCQSLIEANPFEVPPSMIDRQIEHNIEVFERRVQRMTQQKFSLDDDKRADMRASGRDEAEYVVRSGLLLVAVAKQENLQASDDEVAARIAQIGVENDNDPRVQSFYANEDNKEELRFSLSEEKVIEHLLGVAELTAPALA